MLPGECDRNRFPSLFTAPLIARATSPRATILYIPMTNPSGLGQCLAQLPIFLLHSCCIKFHENNIAYLSRRRYIYRPMNTPLFPAWRSQLAALGRKARCRQSAAEIENEFSRFLPKNLLDNSHGCRNRIYTRKNTFWSFLWQVLQPHTSCRAVVRKMQAECETQHQQIDENTSAYCQARSRIPLSLFNQALQKSSEIADRMAAEGIPGWIRPRLRGQAYNSE